MKPLTIAAFALLSAVSGLSQTKYTGFDQKTGWKAEADIWANYGSHQPVFSFEQKVTSPSLDGSSMQFNLAGEPLSNALFNYQIGSFPKAHKYTVDQYVWITDVNAPQALEFGVNQSRSGEWYKFSTRCDFATGVWMLWDGVTNWWVPTTAACYRFKAQTWNHVVLEYEITSTGKSTHFIAFTVNGVRQYINKYQHPQKLNSTSNNLALHIQLDGNAAQTPYTVWVDKWNVTVY